MKPYRLAGFTLIEALMGVALFTAIVFSIPPMLKWINNQGVRHAAEQIQADLQLTRMAAINQKKTCVLHLNYPGLNQYVMEPGSQRRSLTSFRGDVRFLSHGPDGMKMSDEARFNCRGMSTSVAPADIFVTDRDGNEIYRIRVWLPGGISLYRWNNGRWQ